MTPDIKPNVFSLVCGTGEGFMPLNAFDQALLNAGIGDTNLMRMSSIIPPHCEETEQIDLPPGALIPVAYGSYTSSKPGQVISSAIAVALPEDPAEPGVIMEHEDEAPLADVKDTVYNMALEAFRYRDRRCRHIKTIGAEHRVDQHGAVIAAAVLWYR